MACEVFEQVGHLIAGTAGYAGWPQAAECGKPRLLEFAGNPVLAGKLAGEDRDGDRGPEFRVRVGKQCSLPPS